MVFNGRVSIGEKKRILILATNAYNFINTTVFNWRFPGG